MRGGSEKTVVQTVRGGYGMLDFEDWELQFNSLTLYDLDSFLFINAKSKTSVSNQIHPVVVIKIEKVFVFW